MQDIIIKNDSYSSSMSQSFDYDASVCPIVLVNIQHFDCHYFNGAEMGNCGVQLLDLCHTLLLHGDVQ